jgi:hypothetical protein
MFPKKPTKTLKILKILMQKFMAKPFLRNNTPKKLSGSYLQRSNYFDQSFVRDSSNGDDDEEPVPPTS